MGSLVYGKPDIMVYTDHQPLETILNKPLNNASIQLQYMVLHLQHYSFKIDYKKGISLYLADTLSCTALLLPSSVTITGFNVFCLHTADIGPNERLTLKTCQQETRRDPILAKLNNVIMVGCPESKEELDSTLKSYFQRWAGNLQLHSTQRPPVHNSANSTCHNAPIDPCQPCGCWV